MGKHEAIESDTNRYHEHAAEVLYRAGLEFVSRGKHRDNYLEVPEPDERMS